MDRVFLVGISVAGISETFDLTELGRLVKTASGKVVGEKIFKIHRQNPALCIGKGQAEELAAIVADLKVSTVVFDTELKPRQQRNLEKMLSAGIIDRTRLILDIFARSAHSEDGKNQVELARLQYILPRLAGKGVAMMQQAGFIGVRGPGEKQIEYDRRKIEKRITVLKRKLKTLAKRRKLRRSKRIKSGIPIIALCGYTNSGKTTLLNALTKARASAKDRLFETLEPLTRRTKIFDRDVIFIDTVGFIRNIPPQLINAFHSTLEEIAPASLVLVVLDASDPAVKPQKKIVDETLKELGFHKIPRIYAANKSDKEKIFCSAGCVKISALYKRGLEELKKHIYEAVM
ncbi:MAG: GTPase HflX [Elusimicrobia bacterium]|nr:GTPase HflX [Elusimicrobiota bacterium]